MSFTWTSEVAAADHREAYETFHFPCLVEFPLSSICQNTLKIKVNKWNVPCSKRDGSSWYNSDVTITYLLPFPVSLVRSADGDTGFL
jgi:hypothetical protein